MNQKGRSCPTRSRLSTVEINTPDAAELAAFYADITGGQATFADRAWATFNDPGGRIDDLSATEARVLAAGATRYEFQPNTDHCIVLRRPTGHLFCLSTWTTCRRDDVVVEDLPAEGDGLQLQAFLGAGMERPRPGRGGRGAGRRRHLHDPNVPLAPAVLVAAGDVGTSAKQ